MRLSFAGERILAVMAHPDDCELVCAGTLARAVRENAPVAVCVACAGDKGAPAATQNAPDLARVRREEATSAAEALGAELFWLGFPDGELVDGVEQRRKLVEVYRQFNPTLVITHAMEDYHPDHRATSLLAEAASWFASSRGHVTDSKATDAPPALWFADTINMSGFVPEFYIDVTEQVALKKRMLQCHKSQLQRAGDQDFAPLMDLMLRQCETRGAQAGVEAAEAFRSHQAFKRIRAW
jgi:LmbE family N-acetylglucosaminyl deacetylase